VHRGTIELRGEVNKSAAHQGFPVNPVEINLNGNMSIAA
jgi:hypothetical protein